MADSILCPSLNFLRGMGSFNPKVARVDFIIVQPLFLFPFDLPSATSPFDHLFPCTRRWWLQGIVQPGGWWPQVRSCVTSGCKSPSLSLHGHPIAVMTV